MSIRAIMMAAGLALPAMASAAPCTYVPGGESFFGPAGSGTTYLSCIASQAWDALSLADGNQAELETLRAELEDLRAAAPTTLRFDDTRAGCPPAHAAEDPFWEESFVLDTERAVTIDVVLPRDAFGRSDLRLHLRSDLEDRGIVTRTITHTHELTWESGRVVWADTLYAGTWTVGLSSNTADDWGCGTDWGHMNILLH